MSAFLYSAITIGEPAVHLNAAGAGTFAVVDLDAATRTQLTVHTPAEARGLAAAFEAAAVLLEEHAARSGPEMTP